MKCSPRPYCSPLNQKKRNDMRMLKAKCDVLVIGAGTAGCAAALAAAEAGASVMLIEKNKTPGGTIDKAYLTYFCGFFKNDLDAPELLNPHGISLDITRVLKVRGCHPFKYGRVWLQPFPQGFLNGYFSEQQIKFPSLKFCPEYTANEFIIDNNIITDVVVKSIFSGRKIKAKAVIDCTGTGTLTHGLYNLEQTSQRQSAGFIFLLKQCRNLDRIPHLEMIYRINKAVLSGELSRRVAITTFENIRYLRTVIGCVNVPDDMTKQQIITDLIPAVKDLADFLKRNIVEFKRSMLQIPSLSPAHREGLRIRGIYQINENDVLTCRCFKDSQINAAWPIEEWNPKTGRSLRYLSSYYDIPDSSLISSKCLNLFAGGGTISASSSAHASLRVCGTAFASGERAGHLATAKSR